jgi:hypothetical protein
MCSGCRGVLGVFLLAVGWVLAAPGCGAALPSAGADPVPDSGGEEPPILGLTGAVIPLGLAVLSGPDSKPGRVANRAR